jgi:hypothetical protein
MMLKRSWLFGWIVLLAALCVPTAGAAKGTSPQKA